MTPPRAPAVSKACPKQKVKKSKADKPSSPTTSQAQPSKTPIIPTVQSYPDPVSLSFTDVIDGRFDGTVPYRLIPVDVPCSQHVRPAGKDPRIDGLLVKKTYRI